MIEIPKGVQSIFSVNFDVALAIGIMYGGEDPTRGIYTSRKSPAAIVVVVPECRICSLAGAVAVVRHNEDPRFSSLNFLSIPVLVYLCSPMSLSVNGCGEPLWGICGGQVGRRSVFDLPSRRDLGSTLTNFGGGMRLKVVIQSGDFRCFSHRGQ